MDLQLKNKLALVTGSTAGIGFAIASLLAKEGASVVVNGRSQQRVEEAIQRIRKEQKDAQVTGVAADLGTKAGVGMFGQQHTGQSSTYSCDAPAERSMGTTISSPHESQT
jgi:NAD(P)-dependent dehydrogenase (short-subunit alcohol dehydrogenase family)